MKTVRSFIGFLVCVLGLGCAAQPPKVEHDAVDYQDLRYAYLDGPASVCVEASEHSQLCLGLAGLVMNVGCRISVVTIETTDGTKYLAFVDSREQIEPGSTMLGHFVFVSSHLIRRADPYLP
jgi:hypothetical protein